MLKIMVVDDEGLERQALKVIIDNSEYARVVAEASNGRQAIELNRKYNPDVVIMDVKMPGIDGVRAAKIIKEENPDKIIIMVTAYDEFDLVREAFKLGVNDYMLKPIKPSDILNILKSFFVNLKINEEYNEDKVRCNNKDLNIKLAIDYIDKNVHENIMLEKMASLCNLSPCYFSKLFKKEVGVNFIAYVNKIKINKAKEVLKTTDTPILNIALDLGFEDCGYFIRVFKKYEGITPKKYREISKI